MTGEFQIVIKVTKNSKKRNSDFKIEYSVEVIINLVCETGEINILDLMDENMKQFDSL